MSRCFIDHLVVTAPSLEIGAAFVKDVLGVAPQTGGEHLRMGTHNRLLRLGDALYLEVISFNAAVPAPSRPRWFGLDALGPSSPPSLSGWVARTTDIREALSAATEALGEIEGMNRGGLDWLITIPCDGSLPLEGAGPALIEWQTEPHPASKLEDRGLCLARLELLHPDPERVSRLLFSLQVAGPVTVSPLPAGSTPLLIAHINTPQGLRLLSAPQS